MLEDLPVNTVDAAKTLLGQLLVRKVGAQELIGKIVETEAYLGVNDVACHAYRGQTPRNSVMFGPPGRAYVYFTYGLHYCFNVVTGPRGVGEAVLIRALEPLEGTAGMARHRFGKPLSRTVLDSRQLCNGPAKLCQALRIDKQLNGHNLDHSPLRLLAGEGVPQRRIVTATRIGIREDKPLPLRFYIAGNPCVSKI
ncbi:DNA-3-methyladenine glycosylase [Candidatus Microgenomates bacterium]|nr:DNA-3-methyladenine glycosylase [Candidatus Microgenomates bacterium]